MNTRAFQTIFAAPPRGREKQQEFVNYVMQKRFFGNTDMQVSEIGFGAWAIGGGAMIGNTAIGWGPADDDTSIEAIRASVDAGINFFDTADVYGLGHSEELLGNTIGKNKDIIIATKVGNVSRDAKFTTDYSSKHIIAACAESLRRLQRECIDYYQLHSARLQQLQNGECIETMNLLQQQGKIRYWGLSLNTFEPFEDAAFLMDSKWGNGFQLVLNLINQKALALIKDAGKKGYGVIARMPLQFGLLTGKFHDGVSFAGNDHRKNRLTPAVISAAEEALEPVWRLCLKYNCSKTELALSYILSYPEVSTIIPGIRTAEQAKANTSGLIKLEGDDIRFIEALGETQFTELMQLIRQQG